MSNGWGDIDEGIICSGQCRSKGKEKKENSFQVQLKPEVLICHLKQKQSTLMSASSLPCQFNPEVSSVCTEPGLIWSFCERCTQGSVLPSFSAGSVVRSTW